jgi:alpha-glucosidase
VSADAAVTLASARIELEPAEAHGCVVHVFTPGLADGRAPVRPSFLLPREVARADAQADGALPQFGASASEVRARIVRGAGSSLYGAGELAGALERSGRSVRFWNTDSFQYDATNPQLYQSHPYVLVVHADGRATGWLADSIRRGTLALGAEELVFTFEHEPFELFRLEGPDPLAVTQALATLVGRMAAPPLWALGYHQCRWGYRSAAELELLALEFRARGIPCDALWLDLDYMDRCRVFTTDALAFPYLGGLTDGLRALGFRSVAILDPGIAVDSELGAEGRARDLFVRAADGEPAVGEVWPGKCWFPDFTRADARAWWSAQVREFLAHTRLDGLWNDMNEPAVMDAPGKTLADDCLHAGLDGSGGSHARWHNLYGQLMVSATHAGFVAAKPDVRPFVLTRANHLSGARFAATWTGDNRASWEHLRWSIPMVLGLALSGQPFSGPDVGGFSDDPDAELFTRWFELASLLPFFRGHGEKPTRRKEPWAFGPETEAHVRAAIERRMRLLPTLYTLFREAHRRGLPVARPLFFADPADPALRTLDDAFLLGDDLLVAPIVHERAHERTVLFPRQVGGWYPFPEGGAPITERECVVPAPLGVLPLFARAGSVLFEHEPRASTATPAELLVVHAFLDEHGRAEGELFEDAGDGHGHARGEFRRLRFTVRREADALVLDEAEQGAWSGPRLARLLRVHAQEGSWSAARAPAGTHRLPRA